MSRASHVEGLQAFPYRRLRSELFPDRYLMKTQQLLSGLKILKKEEQYSAIFDGYLPDSINAKMP